MTVIGWLQRGGPFESNGRTGPISRSGGGSSTAKPPQIVLAKPILAGRGADRICVLYADSSSVQGLPKLAPRSPRRLAGHIGRRDPPSRSPVRVFHPAGFFPFREVPRGDFAVAPLPSVSPDLAALFASVAGAAADFSLADFLRDGARPGAPDVAAAGAATSVALREPVWVFVLLEPLGPSSVPAIAATVRFACTAPGSLDNGLHYAAALRLSAIQRSLAAVGLARPFFSTSHSVL